MPDTLRQIGGKISEKHLPWTANTIPEPEQRFSYWTKIVSVNSACSKAKNKAIRAPVGFT